MLNYNCPQKEKKEVTVEDIKCFQCKRKYLTQNLFEWHGCFLKTKGSCSKCGQNFQKKQALFKHYVLCEGRFVTPAAARGPASFKAEETVSKSSVKVSNKPEKVKKGPKKKTVPQRKLSVHPDIVKKELELGAPPEDDDDYANYEEDITYDNFGNDSDSNDAPSGALVPEIQMRDDISQMPQLSIKLERLSDPPAIEHKPNSTSELIRNIKKEKGSNSTVITTQIQSNPLKLKIKTERGIGSQSAQILNPMALGSNKPKPAPAQKNVFKLPQELRMKIKLEKKDPGYGVIVQTEQRDEAEPEDEDLLGESTPTIRIKTEKMDVGYGDTTRAQPKSKQLINPMALAMHEKSIPNGQPEKSLVISAVTSINPDSPGTSNEGGGDDTMTQNEISPNAQETVETNDVSEQEPRENLTMVQIPSEFASRHENHSSQPPQCDESRADDNGTNEKQGDDDLDALLKRYEDAPPPADNNDLFQDLLKFD